MAGAATFRGDPFGAYPNSPLSARWTSWAPCRLLASTMSLKSEDVDVEVGGGPQ